MANLRMLLCLALLAGLFPANTACAQAGTGNVSGKFETSFDDSNGRSLYTVDYSYPKEITTGSNLTVLVTLDINQLRGLRLFLVDYRIDVFISNPGKLIAHGSNASGGRYLYEGAHWGPRIISMPINSSTSGAAPGETISANMTVAFLVDVLYDFPLSYSSAENGASQVGSVQIVSPGGKALPIYLVPVLAIAAVLVLALYLKRRRLLP